MSLQTGRNIQHPGLRQNLRAGIQRGLQQSPHVSRRVQRAMCRKDGGPMIGIRPQFGPLFRAGNHFDIGVLGAPQQVSLAGQHLIGLRCMLRPPRAVSIAAFRPV